MTINGLKTTRCNMALNADSSINQFHRNSNSSHKSRLCITCISDQRRVDCRRSTFGDVAFHGVLVLGDRTVVGVGVLSVGDRDVASTVSLLNVLFNIPFRLCVGVVTVWWLWLALSCSVVWPFGGLELGRFVDWRFWLLWVYGRRVELRACCCLGEKWRDCEERWIGCSVGDGRAAFACWL
jgi:hypothetical protein